MAKKESKKKQVGSMENVAEKTAQQIVEQVKKQIRFNEQGEIEFDENVLPFTIEYEVRDKDTQFLTRNPQGKWVTEQVAAGNKFVEGGPSRVISWHPDLADVTKNPEEGYPNGIRGQVAFYFNGRNQAHRTEIWQHPRLNGGKPMTVLPGPAVEFDDPDLAAKFNLYLIDGLPLNDEGIEIARKIVMTPDQLTVADIDNIKNEEIRRVALQRMGDERYVLESNADVMDEGYNDVEKTYEVLLKTKTYKFMSCACPSTGRTYLIRVPNNAENGKPITTRKEARLFMNNGLPDDMCIGRT